MLQLICLLLCNSKIRTAHCYICELHSCKTWSLSPSVHLSLLHFRSVCFSRWTTLLADIDQHKRKISSALKQNKQKKHIRADPAVYQNKLGGKRSSKDWFWVIAVIQLVRHCGKQTVRKSKLGPGERKLEERKVRIFVCHFADVQSFPFWFDDQRSYGSRQPSKWNILSRFIIAANTYKLPVIQQWHFVRKSFLFFFLAFK